MTYDALVIGGGPAGAAAGLILARAGWTVAIVERKAYPRRKVCGEFISATSLPLLHDLGILDDFLRRAGPAIRRVGLFAGDTVLSAPMPQPAGPIGGLGRALGREHLDLLLLEAAVHAGAQLWQPWRAVALHRTGRGFHCVISAKRDFRELAARIVIAAHGSWENGGLPTQFGGAHRPSDLLAFKAHFRDCDLAPELMPLLVFPGGYGGMVHSDAGRVSLSCCIRRDTLGQLRRMPGRPNAAEAVLDHIRRSCGGVDHALRHARLDGSWLSAGPILPGIRKHAIKGIFLTGNAAAEAHPIVAEGISMAVQSAWLLGRRLVAAQDDAAKSEALIAVARGYARDWHGTFATRHHTAAVIAQAAMRPNAAALLLPILKRFPRILTIGARLSGKAKLPIAAA